MIEARTIPTGETQESLRVSAEQRATTIISDMNLRTKDIGVQNRNKVMSAILAEALHSTFLEGRMSAMVDNALREAKEARDSELQSAKSLIAQEAVDTLKITKETVGQFTLVSAEMFANGVFKPVSLVVRKAIWWVVGIAVVNAAVIAALVVLLLRN
jgi:hypothetical protein